MVKESSENTYPALAPISGVLHPIDFSFASGKRICLVPLEIQTRFEKVKKFALLPEPFSADKNELTPSLKIKRNVIEKNYKEIIAWTQPHIKTLPYLLFRKSRDAAPV